VAAGIEVPRTATSMDSPWAIWRIVNSVGLISDSTPRKELTLNCSAARMSFRLHSVSYSPNMASIPAIVHRGPNDEDSFPESGCS
jgi:hypothetical protein